MNRPFNIAKSIGTEVTKRVGRVAGRLQERKAGGADLLEDEDGYLVVLDAPGADPGDIQVRYEDDRLTVRVDRFRGHHEGFEMLYPGRGRTLETTVQLPSGATVDPGGASAVLRADGTLHVTLPKTAEGTDGPVEVDIEDHEE